MRRLFLLVIVSLLAAVGLVALIETDPGYVLISFGLTTIETSLWVALLLLILFYFVFYLVLRLVVRLLASRTVLGDWLAARAHNRRLDRAAAQLEAGDYAGVLTAVELGGTGKRDVRELKLQAGAFRGLGNWPELVALLPRLKKYKAFNATELAELELQAYTGLLRTAPAAELKAVWQSLPAEQRKRAALIECYGRLLLEGGNDLEAEKVLSKAIKRQWDGRLVAQYGRIRGRDPQRRLKLAESWLSKHPEDASLMLCLGRLSLRNNLWGKAREYFETSHRLEPSAEACAELARLLFSLGERDKSAEYYREGLLLRETNLPELPMPERGRARPERGRP